MLIDNTDVEVQGEKYGNKYAKKDDEHGQGTTPGFRRNADELRSKFNSKLE